MKTTGLKQERRTGASTVVMNIIVAVFSFPKYDVGAIVTHTIVSVLFTTLPKFVMRIFMLLLVEIAAVLATREVGVFLRFVRCCIVRSDVTTEQT